MRKIIFFYHVGFAGMDGNDCGIYPDDVSEDTLNEEAWLLARQHAESYGLYPEEDFDEDYADSLNEDEREEYEESFTHNIDGWWEDYDPEKHDGLAIGGGWEFRE